MTRNVAATLGLAIPYAVGFLLYSLSLRGALGTFPQTWFFAVGPGAEPPWYFIGNAWVHALWAAPCALAMAVFSLVAARWIGPMVWVALGLMLISFADPIGQGVNVALHTHDIGERARAGTDWPTFQVYMQSQQTASQVSMVVAMIVAASLIVLYARSLKWRAGRGLFLALIIAAGFVPVRLPAEQAAQVSLPRCAGATSGPTAPAGRRPRPDIQLTRTPFI